MTVVDWSEEWYVVGSRITHSKWLSCISNTILLSCHYFTYIAVCVSLSITYYKLAADYSSCLTLLTCKSPFNSVGSCMKTSILPLNNIAFSKLIVTVRLKKREQLSCYLMNLIYEKENNLLYFFCFTYNFIYLYIIPLLLHKHYFVLSISSPLDICRQACFRKCITYLELQMYIYIPT